MDSETDSEFVPPSCHKRNWIHYLNELHLVAQKTAVFDYALKVGVEGCQEIASPRELEAVVLKICSMEMAHRTQAVSLDLAMRCSQHEEGVRKTLLVLLMR